ncbi:hypothetical protein Emag_007248 [Eimeria magna]
MDYRSLRPSNRSEVQPLHGDLGAPPASSSGTTTGAARSGGNKMERPSRSCYGVSDEKPLAHPQKWAMTLLASRTSLGNALLPLAEFGGGWLFFAVYDIFNESAVVWGFVREVCSCRRLTAGDFSLVAPAEPSAPAREHIKKALAKCRAILQDGRIFVTQQGEDFPRNFRSFVSHILVQLLQMYCHIYRQHFDWLLEGLALHFLEQAQRDIAEAEASEGKQHPANAKHKQQQQQQQQQPQLQQHQAQQDKR